MTDQEYLDVLEILKAYDIQIIDRDIYLEAGKFSVITAYYGDIVYDINVNRYGPILHVQVLRNSYWSHRIYNASTLLAWILHCESDRIGIAYWDKISYALHLYSNTYRINYVFNKEIYDWITQVLKLECPINIFYDWIIEKYDIPQHKILC